MASNAKITFCYLKILAVEMVEFVGAPEREIMRVERLNYNEHFVSFARDHSAIASFRYFSLKKREGRECSLCFLLASSED